MVLGEDLPAFPYEEAAKDDFLTFARCVVIPSASGEQVMEAAMLSYERKGIEPFQRRFFQDVAPSLQAIRIGAMPPCRRFWMERTKKASKDNDLAICVLWLMAYPRRPLFCQIVAADREQAGILKRRAEDILFYNEWLRPFVQIRRNRIISENGLAQTVIEASDKASAHGETPALLILNELVHVAKWDVMQVHYNNASGVPRGVVIISTNAGYKGTKAEVWKKNAETKKERWHIHVWDKKAPWLSDEDVADAQAMNTKSEYVRLFKGRWVSGKGDAVDEDSIERIFRPELEPLVGPEKGWVYIGGLDLGVSHDHAGLVILGVNRDEKRLRVAMLRDWKPSIPNDKGVLEVDIARVKEATVQASKAFSVLWFGYDPAAGGSFFAQELRQSGVLMKEVRFTGVSLNDMATAFMQVIESGRLQCFESEELRRDLGKFHIVARVPQGYQLKAMTDEYGHADVGTALVICLPMAMKLLGGSLLMVPDLIADDGKELTKEEEESMDPLLRDIVDDIDKLKEDSLFRGRLTEGSCSWERPPMVF